MQWGKRRHALVAGFVALATTLAACGSDDDDTAEAPPPTEPSESSDTTSTPSTAATETTEAVAPATSEPSPETPSDGAPDDFPPIEDYDLDGVLRVMWAAPPTTFDPHKSGSSYDLPTFYPVYDRLLHLDRDGKVAPGLATSWEFAADGSYLDLELREGVVFHDGATLDAEAVKANIERAKTVEGSAMVADLAMVESVEVLSPTQVRLHLGADAAHLPAILADRAGMMVSPDAFDNPDLDLKPVGAGMYRVTEYEPGTVIVYERFEDHWEPGAARAARIEYLTASDPLTRFNALRTGEVHGAWLRSAHNAEANATEGLYVVERGGASLFHLQLNRSHEALANVDVRRAINHAIDRRALVDTVVHSMGDPSAQTFPQGYFAHDPETGTEPFPYDPDLARQLLADAGYPDGFEFEMLYQAPSSEIIATALQGQLAEVGITANLRGIDGIQAPQIFYVQQASDSLAALWGGRADPAQTLQLLYSSQGFSNPGRHTTPEMEEAIKATMVVQPDEERNAALQAASAQVVADALDVVLYFPIESYGFADEVLGPEAWGRGFPDFRYVGLAKQ
jgi:peptide/nickel transport system substrate-binding protein